MAANIYQLPTPIPATIGASPNFKFMVCGNTLSEVTSSGFLNQVDLLSNPVTTTDILQVLYDFNASTQVGSYSAFTVSIVNGIITLTPTSNPGEVILPVADTHFANFIGVTGAIGDLGFLPSNIRNPIVTTTNSENGIRAGFVPSFIGTDGSIGLQENSSFYKFNGYVFAGDNSLSIAGSCVSSCGVPEGASFYLTSVTNSGNWTSAILSAGTLGQSAVYNLIDAGTVNSTLAVFPEFPSVITPGNVLIAGPVNGTIADGGPLPSISGAVLLNPGDDQTITSGQLILQPGSLVIGQSGVTDGLLQLLNDAGSSSFSIYSSLSGPSANNNVSITTASTLGQSTTYTMPDPGATTATFNVTATSVAAGNILVAGASAGVLVDSGVSVSELELVSNIKAAQSADIGGAGAGPITIAVTGLSSTSVVTASIISSSSPVSIIAATPGVDSFTVTFSADPGASCFISYVAFINPQ